MILVVTCLLLSTWLGFLIAGSLGALPAVLLIAGGLTAVLLAVLAWR